MPKLLCNKQEKACLTAALQRSAFLLRCAHTSADLPFPRTLMPTCLDLGLNYAQLLKAANTLTRATVRLHELPRVFWTSV